MLVGVIFACFIKRPFATAIAYAVGCSGIVLAIWQGARDWLESPAHQEVAIGTANYPILNPNAAWRTPVEGELASSVPLEYLEATYGVGFATSEVPGPPECRTDDSHGGFPLLHTERIDVSRVAGGYRAVVAVDKFQPGHCGWHFRDVHFQIAGAGPGATPAWITAFDQRYALRGPLNESRSTRMDLWCRSTGWLINKKMVCETLANIQPDLAGRVPAEERGDTTELWVYPTGAPVSVNFHDLDEFVKKANGG